jgi:hypothetical protein
LTGRGESDFLQFGRWPPILGCYLTTYYLCNKLGGMPNELIPVNYQGKSTDLQFSVLLANVDLARFRYMKAVNRMENPNIWHQIAGWATASFKLLGPDGEEIFRLASEGDYIRIDVPGPGPAQGDGYDWVRVEKITNYVDSGDQSEWTGMKVRPSSKPGSMEPPTAHFFQPEATSTFIIHRTDTKVTAFYYGRNEVPNTATPKLTDKIRNALVATGATFSLSEAEWSALSKGFLAEEDK